MTLRMLAALGLLLCLAAVQVPAQDVPPIPATPPSGFKPGPTISGVRDTGQYLPDSAVVGRIDGRLFRIGEFRERWFASYFLDRPQKDSAGRHEFLESMVNKEVLAALAREVNRPLGFEDRTVLRETRQRLLSNATFARLVSDSARYTNEEVRRLYVLGDFRYHLQRIVTDGPATAERARADLLAKRLTWDEAVARYSVERGGPHPGGDLGWVARTELDPLNAPAVFTLPDGAVSPVFRDRSRWQVARIVERRPERQPGLEHLGKAVAQEVLAVKLSQRSEVVQDLIRARIGMAYDSTNIGWAAALFAETERVVQGDDPTPVLDMGAAVPDFQPADTSRVLARWRDGTMTLNGFLAAYHAVPVIGRDKVSTYGAFRAVLDRFIFEPYMAELALERGFDRDSIVVEGMARKEEQLRVEHLFSDSIEARLWVSPEERRAYYESHLPDFYGLQNVTYAAILRPTRAGADSVAARLRAGESAAAVLRADSLAGVVSGSIRRQTERDRDEMYKMVFEELREGGLRVVGPDPQGQYLVVQKLVHDAGRQLPFEEVQSIVDESVQNLKAERLLQEFIARHRARHDIRLFPERLMRIRLLDPRMGH